MFIQDLERSGTDHTPVGNQTKKIRGETLLESVRHRKQGLYIRCVSRPDLAADGPTGIVN